MATKSIRVCHILPLGLLTWLLFVSPILARVANITLAFDSRCQQPGTEFYPLLNNAGNCTTATESSQFHGLNASYLAFGCTVTAYSDPYCSFNATEINLNECGSIPSPDDRNTALTIGSFSVDLCADTTADDWNQPSNVAQSSVIAPSSTSTPSSGGESLSTGTKVGAAVGSVVGFILLLTVGFLIIRRWRKQRLSKDVQSADEKPTDQSAKLEMEDTSISEKSKHLYRSPSELPDPNQPPTELDNAHQRFELEDPSQTPAEIPVYELDSQQYHHEQQPGAGNRHR